MLLRIHGLPVFSCSSSSGRYDTCSVLAKRPNDGGWLRSAVHSTFATAASQGVAVSVHHSKACAALYRVTVKWIQYVFLFTVQAVVTSPLAYLKQRRFHFCCVLKISSRI